MRHKFLHSKAWGTFHTLRVELIPESKEEEAAIRTVDEYKASDQERELVENYLLFRVNIPGYAILAVEGQDKNLVSLKAKKTRSIGRF